MAESSWSLGRALRGMFVKPTIDETTWDDYHTVADGGDGWEAVLDRYEVDAVMVSPEQTAVIDGLSESLGWETVSIDDAGALFTRA